MYLFILYDLHLKFHSTHRLISERLKQDFLTYSSTSEIRVQWVSFVMSRCCFVEFVIGVSAQEIFMV